ncbi:hypothetical protein [Colwellia psychrerythraea]|uniref:Carbohydrate-selective porin OprB n=1 Tax=Colwellia psychrerythraea TaxID=28229 RepID=A0A099KEB3_COLPS|nr:hypothetical protein [Colwellia psychrerythraea]KGJ87958.1 Carbohydrate-selective porin OprB [Colwellia psychrerythraea]
MLNIRITLMAIFCLELLAFTALASEKQLTEDKVAEQASIAASGLTVTPVLTVTHQSVNHAKYDEIDRLTESSETLYSIDIELEYQLNDLGLIMLLEHNSSAVDSGVSKTFPQLNSDAGTTTKRTQVSEFYVYGQLTDEGGNWQLGLAEVSTLIDTSTIANNEVSQFLSAGLINNQTIMFPDYAVSARIQDLNAFGNTGYRLLLSSGAGMEEVEGYYQDLLLVSASHKGAFSALELVTKDDGYQANLGVWQNTNEAPTQSGIYAGIDMTTQLGDFNIRLGRNITKVDTSTVDPKSVGQFYGIAFHKELTRGVFGLGFNLSKYQRDNVDTSRNWEAYYRINLNQHMFLTPALQWLSAGYATSNEDAKFTDVLLASLRLEVYF